MLQAHSSGVNGGRSGVSSDTALILTFSPLETVGTCAQFRPSEEADVQVPSLSTAMESHRLSMGDEVELAPVGERSAGANHSIKLERTSTTFTKGDTHITALNDYSYNDNSRQHYGDVREYQS